jgi:hypothetical protein
MYIVLAVSPGHQSEAAVLHLRQGNAGSNTAADHITVARVALGQARGDHMPGGCWELADRAQAVA